MEVTEVITPPFVPGPVTNLSVSLIHHDGKSPSISVTWCLPDNCTSDSDVKSYHVDICEIATSALRDIDEDDVHRLSTFTTPGHVMQQRVDSEDGLMPLACCMVEVTAESQEGRIGEKADDMIFIRKLHTEHISDKNIASVHTTAIIIL